MWFQNVESTERDKLFCFINDAIQHYGTSKFNIPKEQIKDLKDLGFGCVKVGKQVKKFLVEQHLFFE